MNEKERTKIIDWYNGYCYKNKIDYDLYDINHEINSGLSVGENINKIEEDLNALISTDIKINNNIREKVKENKEQEEKQKGEKRIEDYKETSKNELELIERFCFKSTHTVILGKRREGKCLPKGTLVRTPNGKKPIEKVKEVLSYNLHTNKIETKKAIIHNSGLKQVVRLHTTKGILECSPEHKWIAIRNKKIQEIKAKDLNITDYLLLVK